MRVCAGGLARKGVESASMHESADSGTFCCTQPDQRKKPLLTLDAGAPTSTIRGPELLYGYRPPALNCADCDLCTNGAVPVKTGI